MNWLVVALFVVVVWALWGRQRVVNRVNPPIRPGTTTSGDRTAQNPKVVAWRG